MKIQDRGSWDYHWGVEDFPSGPVVKALPFSAAGAGTIPGWWTKIPHALQPKNQNIEQKQHCKKDFKSGPHKKKS